MRNFLKFDPCNKVFCSNGSFQDVILEEIALEGLDGITFDGLIIRLQHRKDLSLSLEAEGEKNFIFLVLKNVVLRKGLLSNSIEGK